MSGNNSSTKWDNNEHDDRVQWKQQWFDSWLALTCLATLPRLALQPRLTSFELITLGPQGSNDSISGNKKGQARENQLSRQTESTQSIGLYHKSRYDIYM